MLIFDASSIVHAWDNYPIAQFPGLWNWLADQFHANELSLSSVAYIEVGHVAPECTSWLHDNGLTQIDISEVMLQNALAFKALIGVVGDRYGSGVDENDLLIIACARCLGIGLISNEAIQLNLPAKLHNCKIPAVCGMAAVNVSCTDFKAFIKASGAVF